MEIAWRRKNNIHFVWGWRGTPHTRFCRVGSSPRNPHARFSEWGLRGADLRGWVTQGCMVIYRDRIPKPMVYWCYPYCSNYLMIDISQKDLVRSETIDFSVIFEMMLMHGNDDRKRKRQVELRINADRKKLILEIWTSRLIDFLPESIHLWIWWGISFLFMRRFSARHLVHNLFLQRQNPIKPPMGFLRIFK